MWNLFKKIKPEVEVYKIVLYCYIQFKNIRSDYDLTIIQKRVKCYKIYTDFGQYIYDKYGQKYLDIFEEQMCKRGWFDKNILNENKNYESSNFNDL